MRPVPILDEHAAERGSSEHGSPLQRTLYEHSNGRESGWERERGDERMSVGQICVYFRAENILSYFMQCIFRHRLSTVGCISCWVPRVGGSRLFFSIAIREWFLLIHCFLISTFYEYLSNIRKNLRLVRFICPRLGEKRSLFTQHVRRTINGR